MKEVLRSPSPVRIFDMRSSPAPSQSQSHRQSIDNFLSRLGPGMLDTSHDLEDRGGQPRRSIGRKSHEMNVSKGSMEAKQVVLQNNINNYSGGSDSNNGTNHSSVGKSSSKLQMQSPNNNNNSSSNKKEEMQSSTRRAPQTGRPINSMKIKGTNNMRGVKVDHEQSNRHARAVAAASAAAAEAAAVAAHAAAEVMRLTQPGFDTATAYPASNNWTLRLDHDLPLNDFLLASHAATLIQSAYRGHLARQALTALKGLVKLQAVVRGHLVRRQARISLRCMQALVRLQARVRARQVKAALMQDETDENHQGGDNGTATKHHRADLRDPLFQHAHMNHNVVPHAMAARPRHLVAPGPNASVHSPASLTLRSIENMHASYPPPHYTPRPLDTFSRASSVLESEDSRDWDNSALSKEDMELKVLKKQHALAMRQKALSYAENHQRTPTRSSGTPTRRVSSEFYPQQHQRFGKLSFNETEPEKLHRDWSWLEGWMAAHGATSMWESNAAAMWESRDELRDRGEDEEDRYGYLYEEDEVEEDEEEENARASSSSSLLQDHINSDDDPAIKIIEMDRVATPPTSSLPYPHRLLSPSPSPTLHQFSLSTRNNQHLTSRTKNGNHHLLPHR